jgi:hypothetical protein
MPLRRERYPINWPAVSAAIKAACNWQCLECDQPCRRPGEPFDSYLRTLTCAHVWPEDHAPDAAVVCVMVLCARCHLLYDAPKATAARRRWVRRFHLRFEFPEVEHPILEEGS